MKMITEKDIEDMIGEVGGSDAAGIYRLLKDKENLNEFIIAEKLKLTINQIRNIMYKFERYNLISSTRKKDRKKGWYIYFYTFNSKQAEEVVLHLKKERIRILEKQLEREEAHEFYSCPNKCVRLTLENAMEHNFICFECGKLLNPEDKGKNTQKIKDFITQIKIRLAELEKPGPEKKRPKEEHIKVKKKIGKKQIKYSKPKPKKKKK